MAASGAVVPADNTSGGREHAAPVESSAPHIDSAEAPAAATTQAEGATPVTVALSPPSQQGYAGTVYWDKRYGETRACNFDWFFTYAGVGQLIRQQLGTVRDLPCLHVGCGNSTIQEGMAEDGFVSVTNVDISKVVIDQMIVQHGSNTALHYEVCDCRSMHQFPDLTFGSIIDKGTLDAVACAPGGCKDVLAYLREVDRVLQPGGIFLLVSLGAPAARQPVIMGPAGANWTTEVLLLPKPAMYLISEASFSGRVLDPKQAAGSKDTPIDVLGPFTHEQAAEKLRDVHSSGIGREQHDFFFAYVCTKPLAPTTVASPPHPQPP